MRTMHKRCITCILLLCLSGLVKAQVDHIPEDSITRLLCHKWGFRAFIMVGQEVTNMEETETYQFFPDHTFERVTEKRTEKGTWVFNATARTIIIKTRRDKLYVCKLEQGDLVITPEEPADPAKYALAVRTAYRIID